MGARRLFICSLLACLWRFGAACMMNGHGHFAFIFSARPARPRVVMWTGKPRTIVWDIGPWGKQDDDIYQHAAPKPPPAFLTMHAASCAPCAQHPASRRWLSGPSSGPSHLVAARQRHKARGRPEACSGTAGARSLQLPCRPTALTLYGMGTYRAWPTSRLAEGGGALSSV